jgi:autotransporter-associated beta strand protein
VTLGSTLIVSDANGTSSFAGSFGGGGRLTKQGGGGTLTLNGANTHTGGTDVDAGVLIAGHASALGASVGVARVTGTGAASLRFASGITVANAVRFSNTHGSSDVRTTVASGGAFRTGTSGGFASSFVGGTADVEAELLGGVSTLGTTLVMGFRPSLPTAPTNDALRVSDIFSLTGTGADIFVLKLKVAALTSSSRLGWLDGSNRWVNAVEGNIGGTARLFANQAYDPLTMFQLGNYGYDTATNSVWAVLNHNSAFSVIPEPGVVGLVVLGLAAVALRRWKTRAVE